MSSKHLPVRSSLGFCMAALVVSYVFASCSPKTTSLQMPEMPATRIGGISAPAAAAESIARSTTAQQGPLRLTAAAAIQVALKQNPSLNGLYQRFQQETLRIRQQTALPDPQIQYTQFVESIQTRTGEQEFILGVSQLFPWFGELETQGEIAHLRARQALAKYRQALLEVRTQVQEAFYRYLYQQKRKSLLQEEIDLLNEMRDSVLYLYTAGDRGRQSVLRIETEIARLKNELLRIPSQLTQYKTRLTRLLNEERPLELIEAGYEEIAMPDMNFTEMLQTAQRQRPDLESVSQQQDIAKLQYELARIDDYPDIQVGMNYIGIGDSPLNPPDEGEDAFNIGIRFNIPLPNVKRAASKRIAQIQLQESHQAYVDLENRIQEDITFLIDHIETLTQRHRQIADEWIPLALESLETTRIAYETGDAALADIIDAERAYIELRKQQIQIQRDFHLAIAELERTTGEGLFEPNKEPTS